jgi:hypothetical protein
MRQQIIAYLQKVPTIAYMVLLGSGALIGGYQYWAHTQQEIGKRDVLIAQLEITNRDLLRSKDSLAKQYKVDTLRLTKIRKVTDSLTVTVDRWKHDTLEVTKYVLLSDSTIKACTQALVTCEARVGVAQRGWDGARGEIAILKKQMPSAAKPWLDRAIGGAVIGAVVWLVKK